MDSTRKALEAAREALEHLIGGLHVQDHTTGLLTGKRVLWGGEVGAQYCLHVVDNSYSAATVGAIKARLENGRAALALIEAELGEG